MSPVSLDPALIQPHDGRLAVLRLGDRSTDGGEFALEVARLLAPDAEQRELGEGMQAIYSGDKLVAYADPARGVGQALPQLELLSPGTDLAERAVAAGRELIGRTDLLPEDGTGRSVDEPLILRGAQASRRRESEVADYLGFARVRRDVDGVPVVGQGSRSTIMVSADGTEGVHHAWRSAEVADEFAGDDVDVRRVAENIARSLDLVAQEQDVRVEAVELVYYDSDRELIQPAYRFYASYGEGDQITGRLIGHVPFRDGLEDLPPVVVQDRIQPREPVARRLRGAGNRPRIGRYVVRKDNAGWVSSANSFLSGLQFGGVFSGLSPINSQYYWAEPRLFTDENHGFVDAVEVALTEVHGDWGLFTTLQNNADFVQLSGIPTDGYGGAAGAGALAYWILHSCEVIPTSVDTTTSYDVWWNIFNGLRAALGYRTQMLINDEITFTFGLLAALGAPMVSSWLTTVINDDTYATRPTYTDTHGRGTQPYGRPSAVNVLGHADDTIFATGPLSRPSVLQQWWFNS